MYRLYPRLLGELAYSYRDALTSDPARAAEILLALTQEIASDQELQENLFRALFGLGRSNNLRLLEDLKKLPSLDLEAALARWQSVDSHLRVLMNLGFETLRREKSSRPDRDQEAARIHRLWSGYDGQ